MECGVQFLHRLILVIMMERWCVENSDSRTQVRRNGKGFTFKLSFNLPTDRSAAVVYNGLNVMVPSLNWKIAHHD